jgi:hypothetical protein
MTTNATLGLGLKPEFVSKYFKAGCGLLDASCDMGDLDDPEGGP